MRAHRSCRDKAAKAKLLNAVLMIITLALLRFTSLRNVAIPAVAEMIYESRYNAVRPNP
jgi:hypothetical protein